MLNRMYELAEQSANGTYDGTDREQLQKEVSQLKSEIDRIADSANFNGIKLLDGSMEGGNLQGDIAVTNTKVTTSASTSGAFAAGGAAAAQGDTFSYTVSWKEGDVDKSATVSFTANSATEMVSDDGTKYTLTGTAPTVAEMQNAIMSELKKDSGFNAAFDVAVSGTTDLTFTSKTAGADGAQITALGTTATASSAFATALATAGTIDAGATVGKDSMQILDLSKVDVISAATAGTPATEQAIEDAIFEVDGKKFVLVGNTTPDANLSNVPSDVTVIKLDGTAYTAADDAANVAATISRVTGMEFTVDTAGDTTAGIAANSIVYKGDETLSTSNGGLTLQIGDTSDSFNQLNVSIKDTHTAAIGIANLDISTQEGAAAALDVIKDAINYVSSVRGTLGATQNRLDHTINNLSVMEENIQDAESTIRDTDVAEEMMEYTKNNILIQSAQAMLAQANQVPQGVLQLLQ